MIGGGGIEPSADRHAAIYCVVPEHLARKLFEPLRRHFAADARVEIVVERRSFDRRARPERRAAVAAVENSRRRVRSAAGRRVADRRAMTIAAVALPLPRKAARHRTELSFVERVAPTEIATEDADTHRLVVAFQLGERNAFEEIYLRYFSRVYSYFRVAARHAHDAEDLTQDTFARVLTGLARYEIQPERVFRGWLFRIARNVYIDSARRKKRAEFPHVEGLDVVDEETPEPSLDALGWLSDGELMLFVERLPLAQRQVLTLRYMLGLSTQEIADVLDRTPPSVRQLHSRALRFLEARLTAVGRHGSRTRHRQTMRGHCRPANVLRARRFALMR